MQYYEQMIKIGELNEREGRLFLDDNEDSNDKIAMHKKQDRKEGRQVGTRSRPLPMNFDLNMNLLASQTPAENLQTTLKVV